MINYSLNSLNVKEKWQSLANNQFDNCQILHQGTELELDPANLNLGKNHNVVFAGRIMERKGIGTLINAIKLIKNKVPNIKLHVLGDGVYLEKLKDIVNNDNELNGLIEFYGHVSNVRSFFKSADVCIFPSWEKEGLMSTAIEAMYYNGLVITTKGNGNKDFIIDNKNGFLIETKSEKVIADKIIELYYLQYENQNIIKDIKVNAKETIINNFTWKKFVNSLFEFIEIT